MSQRFDKGCSSENPVLGTASFRPEPPHVAQQSRRDKLRVQHQFGATQEPRNLDPNPNTDLINVRHIRNCDSLYNSAMLPSSGILDFSTGNESSSFVNPSTSTFHQPSCDWIMNCVGGPISNTHSLFPSHLYNLRPGVSSYQDLSNELSSQENPKPYGELHFSSPQFYQNTLQELVTSSSSTLGNQGLQMAGQLSPWVDQRQLQQFNSEGEFMRTKVEGSFNAVASETQGLSLSLSSKPPSELHATHLDVGFSYANPKFSIGASSIDPHRAAGPLGPFTGYATILKSSKFLKPAQQLLDEFCSVVIASSKVVKQQYDHVVERGNSAGGSGANCNGGVGDDGVNGGRGGNSGVSSSSFYSSTAGSGDGGAGGGANCQIHGPEIQQKKVKLLYMQEEEMRCLRFVNHRVFMANLRKNSDECFAFTKEGRTQRYLSLRTPPEPAREVRYLEVCRRYKQYHQQMQMVASSFESVAGLSAATPYTSLALKTVSKNFRSLKNAISYQLRHVGKVLGEDFMSSPSSSSRGETMPPPRFKYIDQGLRKQKASENNSLCFLDNNQPVWRPQRGLPERAVAVLRAWLFEHFLHPYPTDTDKHVLATQTGLSRNQVSNWFINARVRLWKPMVEEIHMLESKGMAEADLNSTNKNEGKSIRDDDGQVCDQESEAQSNKPSDCSSKGPVANESSSISMEQWHREKRSRMEECTIPGSMDGGLMSFAYQGGMDIGGLGAVSLTLGLRHHEDTQQQQQQFRHFGSQMLHDFVG